MAPVLKDRSESRVGLWLVPPFILAVIALLTMDMIAFGPLTLYLTATAFRTTGFTIAEVKRARRGDWFRLALWITPALVLVGMIACSSSIYDWVMAKTFLYLLSRR